MKLSTAFIFVRCNTPKERRHAPLNLLRRFLEPRYAVVLASFCAAAGLLTIYPSVWALIYTWRTDDLKSMGLVVPFISFALILRAWRSIGWEAEGSWWGFCILAASATLLFVHDRMLLVITVNKNWHLQVPPLPLVAVVYVTGMVMLFGGMKLLRAAWFPVLFVWAVIPVPQTFSRAVDLPLQHISATVARAFAHALGEPLTQDKLRLMFTPEFGMFIAPGCNGIRGAITLGMAAVVVGYLYRFRWYVFAPVLAGAVLLGYLFNFLRLCLLVIYYKIAVPYPWLHHHAKRADYLIGACLFMGALGLFFTVANKLRRDLPEERTSRKIFPADAKPVPAGAYLAKVAAVLVLSVIFGFDAVKTHYMDEKALGRPVVLTPMPQAIGDFTLVRTWNDTLMGGTIVYTWGEYVEGSGGAHISLGISPVFDVHAVEVCHIARGEDPTWHGQITALSPAGQVDLTAASYNDGNIQWLEASSVCDNGMCKQFSHTTEHVTMVFSYPHKGLPMHEDRSRSVPILLRLETHDTNSPVTTVVPELAQIVARFLKNADLLKLTAPYSKQ